MSGKVLSRLISDVTAIVELFGRRDLLCKADRFATANNRGAGGSALAMAASVRFQGFKPRDETNNKNADDDLSDRRWYKSPI